MKETEMKIVVVESKETLCNADPSVVAENGYVCLSLGLSKERKKRCFMSPDAAVMLWRCFSGEIVDCVVEYRTLAAEDAVPKKMEAKYHDATSAWNVSMRKASFMVNADQALALAWALKKCVSDILAPCDECQPKTKEIALSEVWILTSRRVLTGDSTAEGADLVGGRSEAFSSKERRRTGCASSCVRL